jgi:hypothetical protein
VDPRNAAAVAEVIAATLAIDHRGRTSRLPRAYTLDYVAEQYANLFESQLAEDARL